jgi:tRNA(adenine34) deaminase
MKELLCGKDQASVFSRSAFKPIGKYQMNASVMNDNDLKMMARCVELSRLATSQGELPFACVICKDGDIVVEATNRVKRDADVTRHAEMVAISEAQRKLGNKKLSRCTLYSNVEPCAMCSYCIRETRMSRVVYAIRSPIMGGFSKWKLLQDKELSAVIPEIFGKAPLVVGGVLEREAEAVWRDWHPLIWRIIKYRGCLGGAPAQQTGRDGEAPRRNGFFRHLLTFHR